MSDMEIQLKDARSEKPESSPVVGVFRLGEEWQAALFWFSRYAQECNCNVWLNEDGEERVIPFYLPLQTRLSILTRVAPDAADLAAIQRDLDEVNYHLVAEEDANPQRG